jgi:hypothetical protein
MIVLILMFGGTGLVLSSLFDTWIRVVRKWLFGLPYGMTDLGSVTMDGMGWDGNECLDSWVRGISLYCTW